MSKHSNLSTKFPRGNFNVGCARFEKKTETLSKMLPGQSYMKAADKRLTAIRC